MNSNVLRITACTIATGVVALTSTAAIQDSAHDFTDSGWADDQICKPCHTPHDSDTTVTDAPLWNHTLTTASNYTLYGGGSGTYSDFDGLSRLCLSCHDGTVALDSFGGAVDPAGEILEAGEAGYIGVDLTNDHPVGKTAVYPTDYAAAGLKDPASFPAGFDLETWSTDSVVSCGTCHDPHNGTPAAGYLLRITRTGSQICLTCHDI